MVKLHYLNEKNLESKKIAKQEYKFLLTKLYENEEIHAVLPGVIVPNAGTLMLTNKRILVYSTLFEEDNFSVINIIDIKSIALKKDYAVNIQIKLNKDTLRLGVAPFLEQQFLSILDEVISAVSFNQNILAA